MLPSVLIVDDDPGLRSILASALSALGIVSEAAEDGKSAVDILDGNSNFSVVISDIFMPKMSGLELLETVKAKHPHIPVILMSAGIYKGEEKARISEAFAFFEKPFALDELIHVLNEVLARREG